MAIYPYKCGGCGAAQEEIQSISSYVAAPRIPTCCGGPMMRVFTVPMVSCDHIQPFKSPIDGEVISSRSQQHEHMARHEVVLYDDIAPDIERNRARLLREASEGIADDIAESFHKLEGGFVPTIIPESEFIPSTNV